MSNADSPAASPATKCPTCHQALRIREGHLNADQAAQVTGRHVVTIRAAAAAGEIPGAFKAYKGRTAPWNFTRDGLEQWMRGTQSSAA